MASHSWPYNKQYANSSLSYQSPVNIVPKFAVILKDLPKIDCTRYRDLKNVPFVPLLVHNTMFLIQEKHRLPCITGGPCLADEYVLHNIHFHWGKQEDDSGSEHALDGVHFSGENHFVHYNKKYDDVATALNHKDGLLVIALFVQVSEDSGDFDDIINDQLSLFIRTNERTSLFLSSTLKLLGNLQNSSWYSCPGSLTTVPFSESVTWLIFPERFRISRKQLAILREIFPENRRQIQDWNGRPLIKN